MNIRFHYLRSRPTFCFKTRSLQKGSPIACVAVFVDRDQNEILYQVSSLNKKQDKFNRILAQDIAQGRLLVHPEKLLLEKVPNSAHDITQIVMKHAMKNINFSDTVRKSAKLWLDNSEWVRKQKQDKSL